MNTNNLTISENEEIFLDGVELKNVAGYELSHSAGELAELTIKLAVTVNQVAYAQET